jgi:hypothetical protein
MNYQELLKKYNLLLEETNRLQRENNFLKSRLGLPEPGLPESVSPERKSADKQTEEKSIDRIYVPEVDNNSGIPAKVHLFMSLFRGREDVYAERWVNQRKGTSGYAPVCLNQWLPGVCGKPESPCSKCKQKSYSTLDDNVIEGHLRGSNVIGIYPMLLDETCCFLAMDFDGEEWQKDLSVLRNACIESNIPVAVERSRSGNGGHAWFFFENQIPVAMARKFDSALLTCSMTIRHEIRFKSYDRLFPNHDTMQSALDLMTGHNVNLVFKSNIHQKFAIMDRKVIWYGSINLLSYGNAQESIMRLENSNIAQELIKSMDGR